MRVREEKGDGECPGGEVEKRPRETTRDHERGTERETEREEGAERGPRGRRDREERRREEGGV